MKLTFRNVLGRLTSKHTAIATAAVLLLALGTGAAFAAAGDKTVVVPAENTSIAATSSIAVEVREDGKTYYSTDEGTTWSLEVPAGFQILDGQEENAAAVEAAEGVSVEVREDGEVYYSEDGGKSWSQSPPQGIQISQDGSTFTGSVGAGTP